MAITWQRDGKLGVVVNQTYTSIKSIFQIPKGVTNGDAARPHVSRTCVGSDNTTTGNLSTIRRLAVTYAVQSRSGNSAYAYAPAGRPNNARTRHRRHT